jgi:hypothetical protein
MACLISAVPIHSGVVGVEDIDINDRRAEVGAQDRVQEMDQQVAVLLAAEQGLEDAIDLGVYRVAHGVERSEMTRGFLQKAAPGLRLAG